MTATYEFRTDTPPQLKSQLIVYCESSSPSSPHLPLPVPLLVNGCPDTAKSKHATRYEDKQGIGWKTNQIIIFHILDIFPRVYCLSHIAKANQGSKGLNYNCPHGAKEGTTILSHIPRNEP